jgi:hypothetical protein
MRMKSIKKKQAKRRPTLNVILGRLDRGEITAKQAHDEMQEYDRSQYSKLDRFLEAIAG